LKMWPRFSLNLFFKFLGTALLGPCLSFTLEAQTGPLQTPSKLDYPGMMEGLEKLIQIDNLKFNKKKELLIKKGRPLSDYKGVSQIEVDPDYLNSIILHSNPGYLKLASTDKCRFYDVIVNDLLKNAEGKLANIFVTYLNSKQERDFALISREDFVSKFAAIECPQIAKLIEEFQVKNLDTTLKKVNFEYPANKVSCQSIFNEWLNNARTAYFCKIHEYLKETRQNMGATQDLVQRKAISRIVENKLGTAKIDYLQTLCENLDNQELFCSSFLNVSFWSKLAGGQAHRIYAEDICQGPMKSTSLTDTQIKICANRLKSENDLCLYPGGRDQGILPYPQCDHLGAALANSHLRTDYRDCAGVSDQQAVTNMGRILLNISNNKIPQINGPCSVISSGTTLEFNRQFNNDENWKLEACYEDRLNDKEVCQRTFFGKFGDTPESYNKVIANILKKTRGAASNLTCEMVSSADYNPLLLQYKSGCYIIYEIGKCFVSECKHKIIYNDRSIDFIKIKNQVGLDYFPTKISNEKFSQNYILNRDFKRNGKSLANLSGIKSFFKNNPKGIIHGVGCAEDLLASFFKVRSFNQCSPLPFIIDGIIIENDSTVFITRTAVDSLQAPRMIGWGLIYSGVKNYQTTHPLRLWTLYGLD
jgi:hypothetical protein